MPAKTTKHSAKQNTTAEITPLTDPETPDIMSLRRILVISLGNPGEYRNTYHSAGHIVLEALQRQLSREQPSFASQRIGKQSTLASIGPRYSLLQSPAVMNVSGPWVAKAYKEQLAERGLGPSELGVVLVHDDLEEELGVVKIRDWKRSHRGHNGIKSVNGALQAHPAGKWARISVGIGRPEARDKASVSDFVLAKMPRSARDVLEGTGSRGVLQALMDLEAKWGVEE
jgi:PTH1 family peptidyl-tRNA hydrolase